MMPGSTKTIGTPPGTINAMPSTLKRNRHLVPRAKTLICYSAILIALFIIVSLLLIFGFITTTIYSDRYNEKEFLAIRPQMTETAVEGLIGAGIRNEKHYKCVDNMGYALAQPVPDGHIVFYSKSLPGLMNYRKVIVFYGTGGTVIGTRISNNLTDNLTYEMDENGRWKRENGSGFSTGIY